MKLPAIWQFRHHRKDGIAIWKIQPIKEKYQLHSKSKQLLESAAYSNAYQLYLNVFSETEFWAFCKCWYSTVSPITLKNAVDSPLFSGFHFFLWNNFFFPLWITYFLHLTKSRCLLSILGLIFKLPAAHRTCELLQSSCVLVFSSFRGHESHTMTD